MFSTKKLLLFFMLFVACCITQETKASYILHLMTLPPPPPPCKPVSISKGAQKCRECNYFHKKKWINPSVPAYYRIRGLEMPQSVREKNKEHDKK